MAELINRPRQLARQQLEESLVAEGYDFRAVRQALQATGYDGTAAQQALERQQQASLAGDNGLASFNPADVVLDTWDTTALHRMLYRTKWPPAGPPDGNAEDQARDCGVAVYNTPAGQAEEHAVGNLVAQEMSHGSSPSRSRWRPTTQIDRLLNALHKEATHGGGSQAVPHIVALAACHRDRGKTYLLVRSLSLFFGAEPSS